MYAEDQPPTLEPVIVTATRSPITAFEAPYSANTVSSELIERRAYRTTPQALRNVPGVMVQETAAGQGSPYIRGFTGFRNLFLIDGIRLNNSVFRSGPNQYWNTVDPLSVDRFEIIKGPSSVLYGSDAIGGTVNAITLNPYSYREGTGFGGRVYQRLASAESSSITRLEMSVSRGERTGLLAGANFKTFGSIEAGGDVGTQENTGYDEWDGDLKLEHFVDPDARLVLAYQHVKQNGVPRTHRTVFAVPFHGTTVGDELKRDLDQERRLLYAQYHKEDMTGGINTVRASLSYQVQDEERDRIRSGNRRDTQGFDVGTLGLWTQLVSGNVTYGFDYYHDEVDSFSTNNPVQGPVADDATYDLLGLYVQALLKRGARWEWLLGVRFSYAAADADSVFDPVSGMPTSVSDDWSAFVGNVRARYALEPGRWNLYGGISQGFRAPNLSDLTRLDSARSNEFEVPATNLDPEFTTSFELGLKGSLPKLSMQLAGFYTDIEDQIVRVPTGATNTDGETIVTKDNVGDGYVWGIEFESAYRFHPQWTLFGNLTYMEGKVDTFPTAAPVAERQYIDRLMPTTGQIGLRWERPDGRTWGEALAFLVDRADRLSTRDESDTQRIPPGGTPGYGVLHLRGGWQPKRNIDLTFGIENLFDKAYRVHGSGITMPGRNFVFSITVRW